MKPMFPLTFLRLSLILKMMKDPCIGTGCELLDRKRKEDIYGRVNIMSNLIKFEEIDDEADILRIGGKSFLPHDVKWPVNPNGERLTLIFNLPTDFLNSSLQFKYPKDMAISVFTTYNTEDYF